MYVNTQNRNLGGLGEFDWGQLLDTAVKGYATIQTAKSAAELSKSQLELQKQALQQNAMIYANNPNYSAAYSGAPQSSNVMPFLLIGGAALLLVLLMRN